MGRLQGKHAIITGAASGIGAASALRFAAEGATLVLVDIVDEAHTVANNIAGQGGTVDVIIGDVSDEQVIEQAIKCAFDQHGGLDIMFANAGITGGLTSIFDTSIDDFRRVLEVNLLGVFACIKHSASHMRNHGGGSILCTASVAGLRAGAGPSPYSASKAAIVSLVQTSAYQLSGTGVRINAICPGLIETNMTKPIFHMAKMAGKAHKIGQLNPTKRAGQPDEIANLALFLASDDASYVNGQAIAVDGGLSASLPYVPGKMF